jgi:hypothetical protein
MAYESFWSEVRTNTSATSSGGMVSVTNTFGFYVRQKVTVSGGSSVTHGVVKEVVSSTVIRVGEEGGTYPGTSYDLSGYPIGTSIFAPFQPIVFEGNASPMQLAYENEPIKAIRVLVVDQAGVPDVGSGGSPAAFAFAKFPAASLTAGNNSLANARVALTTSSPLRQMTIFSSLTGPVGVALNGVQIAELEVGNSMVYDLASAGRIINSSSTFAAWNIGAVSTTGTIRFHGVS